eukprot:CAMPEP_0198360528 /NCGR_PEP_ID=MMETSP1450-20131203/138718_1 /TAXON_ID=753684 ORGANISM="Madagascaria erythrocladiodes, Strain CCMP3234" /NCGR_SAMPLE_ID=MMETSP1450 /ASSEMBLY_ACC=CAM_ASM_001115 /LENGTH=41 /DNA_ID= /DNA_START= /DNA_END= /DNA_ORIENTATION=
MTSAALKRSRNRDDMPTAVSEADEAKDDFLEYVSFLPEGVV